MKMGRFLARALATIVAACALCFSGCKDDVPADETTVYMPDGAPALALAGVMKEDSDSDGITYRVVAPALIKTKITYSDMDKNADFCVLPVTAACKLVGDGTAYKMLGALTQGNLYLISKTTTNYTQENLSDLIGKTVGVLQINEVPGLTLKATLNKLGLSYVELVDGASAQADKVNLKGIADATAIDGSLDCYLLAEPAVSVQVNKNGYTIVGDLQALYSSAEIGYPQAVLVAKTSILQEKADWTKAFLEKIAAAGDWLKSARGEEIVQTVTAHLEDENYATSLKAPLLTADVLARCGVRFSYARDCKVDVDAFMNALKGVNANAAVVPSADFYWTE
jgi:hypothetical protein